MVILICISLITNDVEHVCMCVLAICMSSLEKYVLKSFVHFKIALFFLLLSCTNSLYILDTSPLSDIRFANTFSSSLGWIFNFMMVLFAAQKF